MRKFTKQQKEIFESVSCALVDEGYSDGAFIHDDAAMFFLEDYEVRVTAPMEDALQFTLHNESRLIDSVVTEYVRDELPTKRLIVSLFSVLMLRSFKLEWNGYTLVDIANQFLNQD